MNENKQQLIALSAVLQSLSLVKQVAMDGQFDAERAQTVLQALTCYNPRDTLAAYGDDITKLRFGAKQLKKLFTDDIDRDIASYTLAVMTIEMKLVKNNQMRQRLQSDLQCIENKMNNQEFLQEEDTEEVIHFAYPLTQENIIAAFAGLYKQTASQTEPRIMVSGSHQYLQAESSANQIRALLLAALRGAAFFRHHGGKRFDLMMKRKFFLKELNHLFS